MVASDHPRPPAIEPETAAALQDALSRSARTGRHDDDLAGLLERASTDARERGVHAEQLLVALKHVWNGVPEVAQLGHGEQQKHLLEELVTRCIQLYYSR